MKIAVVRVRGKRKLKPKIDRTLELLRLDRPNHCVIVDDSKPSMGMLGIVKDYVTFGKIDGETLFKLIYKRGMKGSKRIRELSKKEEIQEAAKKIFDGKMKLSEFVDPVFMLHPPRKGYKSIKKAHPLGDLGKREEMNTLLRRMI